MPREPLQSDCNTAMDMIDVATRLAAAGGGDGGREAGDKSWGEIINCHSA